MVRYFDAIKRDFSRTETTPEDHDQISDRIRYWFKEDNIRDLIRLDLAIRRQTPIRSQHRKFFLCGFSNILKPTSLWLTKSTKAQRDLQKSPRAVMEAFEEQIARMRQANQQLRFPTPFPRVRIKTENFLASTKAACRTDLIVTSPPYVTSYNYADIHQLSILWLGYASDYRVLRKNMLGNQYGVELPESVKNDRLGQTANTAYRGLLRKDRYKADSVARYFLDMDKAVAKCEHMLNYGGMAVFVIGNTDYRGVRIDNAKHLEESMKRAGFLDIRVIPRKVSLKTLTPYRDARGRFTRDSTQRKVYGQEFVVIGRK